MPHISAHDQRHYQRRRTDAAQQHLTTPGLLAVIVLTFILGAFISAIDAIPLPALAAIAIGITITLIIVIIRSTR